MASVIQSGRLFLQNTWVAIVAGASAIADPLDVGKMIGVVEPGTDWAIGDFWMRAIFLAILFGWLFRWYHLTRTRYERETPTPNIPLYLACRWIAKHSEWAAKYPAARDDEWITAVDKELMSKLLMGQIHFFGERRRSQKPREPMQYVTPADAGILQWDSSKLASEEPPTHGWTSNGVTYYDLHLDKAQVERIWPRRSLLARITRQSPVERIEGYQELFAKQDQSYASRSRV